MRGESFRDTIKMKFVKISAYLYYWFQKKEPESTEQGRNSQSY